MDFPTALLRDLLELSAHSSGHGHGHGDGDGGLDARLTVLVSALRAAVPSYQGLSLTVHDNGHPVSLTSFLPTAADGEITTSLRLPFAALLPGFDAQSQVIFYAATPGAFVDLAADLGHALHAPTILSTPSPDPTKDPEDGGQQAESRDGDGQQGDRAEEEGVIVLDADLPPPTVVSQLTGLHEMSTINRAVGMLIDQGHHPDDAHATLRRHAAAAGLDTHLYAARLLRR